MPHYASLWVKNNIVENRSPDRISMLIERPLIVCLCGSSRFYNEWQEANYRETMAGKIVLTMGFIPPKVVKQSMIVDGCMGQQECLVDVQVHGGTIGCTPTEKIRLDVLHKLKIDLADEVFVINVGGYIGESTASEIEHALAQQKPIRYLEPIKETSHEPV